MLRLLFLSFPPDYKPPRRLSIGNNPDLLKYIKTIKLCENPIWGIPFRCARSRMKLFSHFRLKFSSL